VRGCGTVRDIRGGIPCGGPSIDAWVRGAVLDANAGVSPRDVLGRLHGWDAATAVAAAVYLWARHPRDFESAVLEGANSPGDSDSLASMAGALVGAGVGLETIRRQRPDWVTRLERVNELCALADDLADAWG